MLKAIGIALIIIAVALAIVPFFSDCESDGKMITLENGKQISMKCHWTGRAEIGVAVPLLVRRRDDDPRPPQGERHQPGHPLRGAWAAWQSPSPPA